MRWRRRRSCWPTLHNLRTGRHADHDRLVSYTPLQVYDAVEEAQKLLAYYKIYELPATLVIDPVTGAPMRQWTGFVIAERCAGSAGEAWGWWGDG